MSDLIKDLSELRLSYQKGELLENTGQRPIHISVLELV